MRLAEALAGADIIVLKERRAHSLLKEKLGATRVIVWV